MSVGLWILVGVLALILVIVIWYIACFNTLVRLRNDCKESFATIDVYLKKRYAELPNLVNIVKGYAKHEQETLTLVINARNNAVNAKTTEEKIEAENQFQAALKGFNVVVERYPDLKANQNFLDLSQKMSTLETEIANSRRFYNACVKALNTKIEMFPSSIVANSRGFKQMPLFEITNAIEREDVKVEF